MVSVSFDDSEVRALADDLTRAPAKMRTQAASSLRKEALNVKQEWRFHALRSKSFRPIEPFINFDVTTGEGYIEAEIGPVKKSAGRLANIAIFGTSRGGGTVIGPDELAAHAAPSLEKHLAEIVEGLL